MGLKAFDAKFPEARYLIAVFTPSTGELDCLVDAAYLTAARTGATTGVATRWMTGPDGCREVGVIGSGLEARTNLEAVLAVREVERVKVFSPNPERRERFAREVAERFDIEVLATDSAAEAADAPCVVAATNTGAGGPVALQGAWLRDDAHLNTIGATAPVLREVDPETFARAATIVVDTEHAAPRVRRHHRCGEGRGVGRAARHDAGAVGRRRHSAGARRGSPSSSRSAPPCRTSPPPRPSRGSRASAASAASWTSSARRRSETRRSARARLRTRRRPGRGRASTSSAARA